MATLLLQAAGAYLGGLFGAVGATIGTAAGALGGYLIDQALINGTQHIKGARLSQMQPLTGEDGAPLARVYGTARLGGTLIWATRFEENAKTERKGAKGGPKVTTYSYFANFAVAFCEGEIAHVRRIWADGRELDQTDFDIRIYKGGESQLPDPLIEAKQGAGNAPAYRGTAYAVFDRFPLENFGNRIPQLQFEVIRTLGGHRKGYRAITLIPGSTEFGLAPDSRCDRQFSQAKLCFRTGTRWWQKRTGRHRWTNCRRCVRTLNRCRWWWPGSAMICGRATARSGRV